MTTTDKIRKLLKEKHKTQRDLAEYLGNDRNYGILSAADHGKTTLDLNRVAAFLGVAVDELVLPEPIHNEESTTPALNIEEQYIIDTYRMCNSYEAHRSLLRVCEQLRAENDLGSVTTA